MRGGRSAHSQYGRFGAGLQQDHPCERGSAMGRSVVIVIYGAPRTKKNHGRRVYARRQKRTVHVPSEAYEFGCAAATLQIPAGLKLPDQPYNRTDAKTIWS